MKRNQHDLDDVIGSEFEEPLEFPREPSLWHYRAKVAAQDLGDGVQSAARGAYHAGAAVVKTALRIPLYLIGGNLPGGAQRSLEQRFGKGWFDAVLATRWSAVANVPLYSGAVYFLATQADRLESLPLSIAAVAVGVYGFLETSARLMAASRMELDGGIYEKEPLASGPGWLLYLPLRVPLAITGAAKRWYKSVDDRARALSDGKEDATVPKQRKRKHR